MKFKNVVAMLLIMGFASVDPLVAADGSGAGSDGRRETRSKTSAEQDISRAARAEKRARLAEAATDECVICKEVYGTPDVILYDAAVRDAIIAHDEAAARKVYHLKCAPQHKFHGTCIYNWLAVNSACPLCKRSVLHADGGVEQIEPGHGIFQLPFHQSDDDARIINTYFLELRSSHPADIRAETMAALAVRDDHDMTPLMHAAIYRALDVTEALFAAIRSVHGGNIAAATNDIMTILNTQNDAGLTPLMIAADHSRSDVIMCALRIIQAVSAGSAIDVRNTFMGLLNNARDASGQTVFMHAAQEEELDADAVKTILNAVRSVHGNDAIAARAHILAMVSERDNRGRSACMLAAEGTATEAVDAMFKAIRAIPGVSADTARVDVMNVINAQDNTGMTALMHAACHGSYGQEELMERIFSEMRLVHGGDAVGARKAIVAACNMRDTNGMTALMHAAKWGTAADAPDESGAQAIFEAILTAHDGNAAAAHDDTMAVTTAVNAAGWTPLMIAAYYGHAIELDFMLHAIHNVHGNVIAVMNKRDDVRGTSAMLLAQSGKAEALQVLLAAVRKFYEDNSAATRDGLKVILNAQDDNNWTPLIWAVRYGHEDVVNVIFEALRLVYPGAANKVALRDAAQELLQAQTLTDLTALDCAKKYHYNAVVEQLMQLSAEFDSPQQQKRDDAWEA